MSAATKRANSFLMWAAWVVLAIAVSITFMYAKDTANGCEVRAVGFIYDYRQDDLSMFSECGK